MSLSNTTETAALDAFLSEAMAKDLINRAKQRKSRAEEEALLLIL